MLVILLINFLDKIETAWVIVNAMTAITADATNGITASSGNNNVPVVELVTHNIETISSKRAAEMLEIFKGPNRKTSEAQVLKYQSDMESGRWHFEGAPIRISRSGKLLDGKHRLTALANTVPEMEIRFLVVYGLDDDSQLYMDQGRGRTVGQQLGLRGIGNGTTYGAIAKLYLDWTRNRLFRGAKTVTTSKPEQTEWVINHQDILEALSETNFQQVDAPPSVVGAFGLAVLQINPEKAVEFIDKLVSGVGLMEGDPILALDRRLRNIRRSGVRVGQREYLAYFIKAWNAWVMGDRLQKLQISNLTEDNFPELFAVSP